jgi:hypothetical protein
MDHTSMQDMLAGYLTGALTANLIAVGDKLGLYEGLKRHGPSTPEELAAALGLAPRYITEWARQQAAAKVISCDDAAEKFWLDPVQTDCLTGEHGPDASPYYSIGAAQALPSLEASVASGSGRLLELFRSGKGLSYDNLEMNDRYAIGGDDVTCGTARELVRLHGIMLLRNLI